MEPLPRRIGVQAVEIFVLPRRDVVHRLVAAVGHDLDAWQRWVRGEATPAIRGDSSRVTALQRGLGSLMSRVLGGDRQQYEKQSGSFTAGTAQP